MLNPASRANELIGLEHGLHKDHALIAPKLLLGLLGLRGLTCCCLKRLTIAVIAAAVQVVVGLVGTAVGFVMLAELLTVILLVGCAKASARALNDRQRLF